MANLFLTLLDGTDQCLQLEGNEITGQSLRNLISLKAGVPEELSVRIVSRSREIKKHDVLLAEHGQFEPCCLQLRLRGGKGGFGAMLRASGKTAAKETNFGAMRDLSGRRVRDVEADEKMRKWASEARERELQKEAEAFVKKKEAEMRREAKRAEEEAQNATHDHAELSERIQDGVEQGIKAAVALAKEDKKRAAEAAEAAQRAKKRNCMWAQMPGESDDDSFQSEEDESEEDEPAAAATATTPVSMPAPEQKKTSPLPKGRLKAAGIDFAKYDDAEALQAGLGADRLKAELAARGLKCSGTPADRATRLFLLKSTPLEKLDKKHFAPGGTK